MMIYLDGMVSITFLLSLTFERTRSFPDPQPRREPA
jgi:hypothetical protein